MQPFQIFKAGRHTASNGKSYDFTEQMLRDAVASYDPSLHEAPIVVGHPKDNHPAYGWIKGLEFAEDGSIIATPGELDPEFAELVEAKRYKKRSASWYLPDNPANPTPGKLHLRHVGFLGAQPPAIKGLKEVSFAEDAEVVEFADTSPWIWSSMASMFRGLRDWIIAEKGLETADKLVPNYAISDIEAEGRKQLEKPSPLAASFTEPESSMKPEEIKALQDQLAAAQAENATLKANAKPADFAEREAALAKREQELARKDVEGQVDSLIAAGKLTPAQKATTVDFAMTLNASEATVDFAEGDKTVKVTQRTHYLKQLDANPTVVDFGERSRATGGGKEVDEDIEAVNRKVREQVASGGKIK